MNIRFVGWILGLLFGLITNLASAQVLWLGGVNDLNQLRIERSPGLSPIYSDSDPLENFDPSWSQEYVGMFFIGGNISREFGNLNGEGIVLQFASAGRKPLVTGRYSPAGHDSLGATMWLYVPLKYGNFGDMTTDYWMREAEFTIHEVEFGNDNIPDKFAADFIIGKPDVDTSWLKGEFRYQSSFPVTIGNVIPEPETYAFMAGIGLAGLCVVRRRFKK